MTPNGQLQVDNLQKVTFVPPFSWKNILHNFISGIFKHKHDLVWLLFKDCLDGDAKRKGGMQ